MKKRTYLLIFIVLTIFLSISAISANDENDTDLFSENLTDNSSDVSTNDDEVLEDFNDTLKSFDDEVLSNSSNTNTTLEVLNTNIYYGSDYNIILKDSNGTGISNQKIIIKIDTKNYEASAEIGRASCRERV